MTSMLVSHRRRHGGRANRIRGELPARTAPYLAVPFPLISRATCLILPSLGEGFGSRAGGDGLRHLGCRERCGLPSLRWQDAAILVEATTCSRWRKPCHQVLTERDLREELRADGLRQAARFSWRRTEQLSCPPPNAKVLESPKTSTFSKGHHGIFPGIKQLTGRCRDKISPAGPEARRQAGRSRCQRPVSHCRAESSGDGNLARNLSAFGVLDVRCDPNPTVLKGMRYG